MTENDESNKPEAKPESEKQNAINQTRVRNRLFERALTFSSIYYSVPIAIGASFLSAAISLIFGLLPIFNELSSSQSSIDWSSINFQLKAIEYFLYGGLAILIFSVISSYFVIYRRIESDQDEIKENNIIRVILEHRIHSRKNAYLIHLALGLFVLVIAFGFYFFPELSNRDGIKTWTGFEILRHKDITFTSLDFNLLTLENFQALHIFYATNPIYKNDTFLMFSIPYLVTMTNSQDSLRYSLPGEWKVEKNLPLKTTLVYKYLDCSGREICNDQLNMYFSFDERRIDGKNNFRHSIDIPFMSMQHPVLFEFANEKFPKTYDWASDWGMDKTSPRLSVSVIDQSTEYNSIPDGYLQPRKYNETKLSNAAMVWTVPDHDILFHLDFVNPYEQSLYEKLNAIALILLGTAASSLVLAAAEYKLRKAVKTNESDSS